MSTWAKGGRRVYLPDEVLEALGYETVGSRLRKLEALANAKAAKVDLAEVARTKLARDQPLTVAEVAAHFGVSDKTVRRWSGRKTNPLPRCAGLGGVVRFAARDVLRLASAPRKER